MSPKPPCQASLLEGLRNASLQTVLIIPFVLQLAVTVGLVGYLSFRNGQKAVNDLASQLRNELSARIDQHLQGYIRAPYVINRLNATALRQGDLRITQAQGGYQLLQQMKLTPFINAVYCGNGSGDFFGVSRRSTEESFADDVFQVMVSNPATQNVMQLYAIDSAGNPSYFLEKVRPYDPRTRPWYRAAMTSDNPTWSSVYLDFTSQLPTVTASLPVYNRIGNALLGVCGVDVVLSGELRDFLKGLDIGRSGETFIIERSGILISSSTDESLAVAPGEEGTQLKAIESSNPLIQATARYLSDRFGDLNQITYPQQLDFTLNGQRQFLQVLPFAKAPGLDWLIVVVVPEADFMGQIYINTYRTIALCIAALAVATGVGILISRWISHAIARLSQASEKIASGDLTHQVEEFRLRELRSLAASFNSMTDQLKHSFETLEQQKNAFARFFPFEFLQFLHKDSITEVQLGDYVSKEMAVLFSDIRSFTSRSEKGTPQETFDFINEYLQWVSPEIRTHQGVIVKFLGDGMMAVFPDGVMSAMQAGIAQFKQLQAFNQAQLPNGSTPITIGLALHYGPMMVGMIGEPYRVQGDALSDTVNLTARLESLTKYYGVSMIISGDVWKRLPNPEQYQLRFLDRVIVWGRTEAIAIYEVLDVEQEPVQALKRQTLSVFQKALSDYTTGNLESAKVGFEQVLEVNVEDRTAQLYLARIRQLQQDGLPPGWTGVWTFAQK